MINLYPYQQDAYDKLLEGIASGEKRFSCVLPTGAGKSYIMWKWAEDNPKKHMLVVTPSKTIFSEQQRQLHKAYKGFKGDRNVEVVTYALLGKSSDEAIASLDADLIVLDEFHHAGSRVWGDGVASLVNSHPQAALLGLSATPFRASDAGRDMGEEIFGNNYIARINILEAWEREDIPLHEPMFYRGLYDAYEDLAEMSKRIDKIKDEQKRKDAQTMYQEARRSIAKSSGLEDILKNLLPVAHGRYICFCQGVDHLEKMLAKMDSCVDAAGLMSVNYIVHVNAEGVPSEIIHRFEKDDSSAIKFLWCIDMLSEGVHCENDGVFFFRPTSSATVFQQQLGRASSVGSSGTKAVFDLVNNLRSAGLMEMESRGRAAFEVDEAVEMDSKEYRMHVHILAELAELEDLRRSIENMTRGRTPEERALEWIAKYGRSA